MADPWQRGRGSSRLWASGGASARSSASNAGGPPPRHCVLDPSGSPRGRGPAAWEGDQSFQVRVITGSRDRDHSRRHAPQVPLAISEPSRPRLSEAALATGNEKREEAHLIAGSAYPVYELRNPIRVSSGCTGTTRAEPMVLRRHPRSWSSLMLMETISVAASVITSVAVSGASSLSRAPGE
jgi:hypothetical protein